MSFGVRTLLASQILFLAAATQVQAQTVSVSLAAIHAAPAELDGALGCECTVQARPRGAPFALVGDFRYVRQTIRSSAMTCQSYWPNYDACLMETVRREGTLTTWLGGIVFDPPTNARVQTGIGIGLEVNRITGVAIGEATGREIAMISNGESVAGVALFIQFGVRPVLTMPLELNIGLRASTASFGGYATDASWQMQHVGGVIGASVGARYRFMN